MRAHVLNSGNTVVNTIVVSSLDALPDLVEATAGQIGDTYDPATGTFTSPPVPLDTARAAKHVAVQAEADRRMNAGYAHDFGPSHGVLTLQTREHDRANWLTVDRVAQRRIDAGEPDFAMRPIRTAENVNVPVTAAEAAACMMAMQTYLGAVLEHAWVLKDAIAATADQATLDAVDITTGWPA